MEDNERVIQDYKVDTADRLLTDVLPNLQGDAAQIVKRLIVDDAPNALKDIVISGLAETVRTQSAGLKTRVIVSISEVLGDKERKLLSLYPELNIRFERKSKVAHAFASASRKCERAILYMKAGYSREADFSTFVGMTDKPVYVKELGGDPLRSILGRERYVHHCSPILSSYDQTRIVSRRSLAVARLTDPMLSEWERHSLRTYLVDSETFRPSVNHCFGLAQRCNVKAMVLIALHSVYDVSLQDFGDAMDSAGADIAYGSLLYDCNMFLNTKGTLPLMGASYSYSAPTCNSVNGSYMLDINSVSGNIYFSFRTDDGYNYEHDFQTYAAWLTCSKFTSGSGNTFNLEMLENRGGAQFFKVTRDLYPGHFPPVPRSLWLGAEDKMLVTFYDVDVAAAVFSVDTDNIVGRPVWDRDLIKSQLKLMRFFVDRRLVEYVLEFARGVGESHFKPDAVFNFLRAKGSKVMYSGAVTEEYHGLTLQQMSALSMVIYLVVYEVKYRHGKVLRSLMISLNHQRDNCYQNSIDPSLSNVVEWDDGFGAPTWFDRLIMWITSTGKYSEGHINIDDMLVPGGQFHKLQSGPYSAINTPRLPLVVNSALTPTAFNDALNEHFGLPVERYVCSEAQILGEVDFTAHAGFFNWMTNLLKGKLALKRTLQRFKSQSDLVLYNTRLHRGIKPGLLMDLVHKYDRMSAFRLSKPDDPYSLISELIVEAPREVFKFVKAGRGYADTTKFNARMSADFVGFLCVDVLDKSNALTSYLTPFLGATAAQTLLIRFDIMQTRSFLESVSYALFTRYTKCAYVFPDDDYDSSCLLVCTSPSTELAVNTSMYYDHFVVMVEARLRHLTNFAKSRVLTELKDGPLKPLPKPVSCWPLRLIRFILSIFRKVWNWFIPPTTSQPPALDQSIVVTITKQSTETPVSDSALALIPTAEFMPESFAVHVLEVHAACPDVVVVTNVDDGKASSSSIEEVVSVSESTVETVAPKVDTSEDVSPSDSVQANDSPFVEVPAEDTSAEPVSSTPIFIFYSGGTSLPYFPHSKVSIELCPAPPVSVKPVSGEDNGCCVRALNAGRNVSVVDCRLRVRILNISNGLNQETEVGAMAGDDYVSYIGGEKRIAYHVFSGGRVRKFDNDFSWMVVSLHHNNFHYDLCTPCSSHSDVSDELPGLSTDQLKSIMDLTGVVISDTPVPDSPFLWNQFVYQCYDDCECRDITMVKLKELEAYDSYRCVLILPDVFLDHPDLVAKRPWVLDIVLNGGLTAVYIDSSKPNSVGLRRGQSNIVGGPKNIGRIFDKLSGTYGYTNVAPKAETNKHVVRVLSHLDSKVEVKSVRVVKIDCDRTDIYVREEDGHIKEWVGLTKHLIGELVHLEGVSSVVVVTHFPNVSRVLAAIEKFSHSVEVEPTEKKRVGGFSPNFITDNNPYFFYHNAMEEQRALWAQEAEVVSSSLGRDLPAAEAFLQSQGTLSAIMDNNLLIYDLRQAKFVNNAVGRDVNDYQWGMTVRGLVHTKEFFTSQDRRTKLTKDLLNGGCRALVFSPKSKLIHGIQLKKLYEGVNLSLIDFSTFDIRMVQGVPGAGKSHTILTRNLSSANNLILTVSREGREDLERRAKSMRLSIPSTRIRTVDSFLLNPNSDAEHVWLDEALMKHCGSWMWVYHLSGCKRMYVVGDRAQIPYIERTGLTVRYAVAPGFDDVEYLSTSYRCPLDIVYWLNSLGCYSPEKVWGCSSVQRSVSYSVIQGVGQVPRLDGCKYLTFTQAEKDILANERFDVNTVHEYQGNQKAAVVLVRLENKEANRIYTSEAHILVALTRHTERFVYATVRRDCIVSHCEKIIGFSDSELVSVSKTVGGGRYVIVDEEVNYDGLAKTCTLKTDTAVSPANRDKLLSDLIVEHCSSSYLVTSAERAWKLAARDPDCYLSTNSDVNVLQSWLDGVLPGSTTTDRRYDHHLFEMSEIVADLENVVLGPCFLLQTDKEYITPLLRTSVLPKVPTTQKQVVKAFLERNGNVPQLQGNVDDGELALTLLQDLKKTCSAHNFRDHIIVTDYDNLTTWLSSQPPATRKALKTQLITSRLCDRRFDAYEFMLKNLPKPDLELGGECRYKSPQTIAYQTKDINSLFSPIMKELMDRFLSVISPDFLFYNAVTPECFAAMVTDRLPLGRAAVLNKFTEVDFSKYDKSQGLVMLLFEIELMREFGVPEWLMAIWVKMHKVTWLIDQGRAFKAKVEYQRKSGDSGTWRFNTLVLVAVLNSELRLYEKLARGKCVGLFSGDDSVIFCDEDLATSLTVSNRFRFKYNLETKLMNYKLPYFCSKFLVNTLDGWIFVPDTVKMIIKLGRLDLVDMQHVEEYRVSFHDGLAAYKNPYNWMAISRALNDRYNIQGQHDLIFMTLLGVSANKDNFAAMYKDDRLVKPVYNIRPKLEI